MSNIIYQNLGALSALKGYRTQFLYTLYSILFSQEREVIFPEGYEDYSVTTERVLHEVVQVKNLASPLQLSDFKPKAVDGFVARCLALLEKHPKVIFKIVSFGQLGAELRAFQKHDKRKGVQAKLEAYGYEGRAVQNLLDRLQIIRVEEEQIQTEVSTWLRESVAAIDVDLVCDLLLFWMYQLAEAQESVTRGQLLEKVQDIGVFISDRHRFLSEFGRSIFPLSASGVEEESLQEEYQSGIAAKYAHILANLDIPRPEKMSAIHEAFTERDLVIVQGASGQGKSTLAYRYLHDYYPESFVYCIAPLTDPKQVLNIAQAIRALARPLAQAFVVYVDVAPGDQHWVGLCRQLSGIANCRVLVTISEEDLRRSASIGEFVTAAQLSLQFTAAEAELLFAQLEAVAPVPHFLNFKDAWSRFGGEGPLLEFVYLLRQGELLKE